MAYRCAMWKADGQGNTPRNNETLFPIIVAGFVYDQEPEDIADECYGFAEDRADKCRVVLMRNPGQQYQSLPDINDGGALSWFVGGGLTDAHYAVVLRFFRRWKENGNIVPDAIVCDFEPADGGGRWVYDSGLFPTKAENAAFIASMSNNSSVKPYLPRKLRDVSESRWLAALQSPSATEVRLVAEWNALNRRILTAAQRAMVTRAFQEVFGKTPNMLHNYDDVNTETWTTDHNGWPVAPGYDTMDGMSAPVLAMNATVANTISTIYGPGGIGTTGTNAQNCTNFLIHLINRCNSVIGPKSAWITNSRYDPSSDKEFEKLDAWREYFLHYAASGGDELVMCFCPKIRTPELDEMEDVLKNTKRRLGFDPRRHKPVPFNSATYTTNGYTTTFSSLNFSRVNY